MFVADHPKERIKDLQVLTRKDLMKNNHPVIPTKFFVHTYHNDNLEEHTTEPGYDFTKWNEWLLDRRIYIEKTVTPEKPKINESLLI